jgi:hypothetical protein
MRHLSLFPKMLQNATPRFFIGFYDGIPTNLMSQIVTSSFTFLNKRQYHVSKSQYPSQ